MCINRLEESALIQSQGYTKLYSTKKNTNFIFVENI